MVVLCTASLHSQNVGVNWSAFSGGGGSSLSPSTSLYLVFGQTTEGTASGQNIVIQTGFLAKALSGPLVSVKEPQTTPLEFTLSQNYPNPFNPTTTIRFSLPASVRVTLSLYNVLGEEVATLVNEEKGPGLYAVRWNASNVPTGIYYSRLIAGTFTEIRKLVLVR